MPVSIILLAWAAAVSQSKFLVKTELTRHPDLTLSGFCLHFIQAKQNKVKLIEISKFKIKLMPVREQLFRELEMCVLDATCV